MFSQGSVSLNRKECKDDYPTFPYFPLELMIRCKHEDSHQFVIISYQEQSCLQDNLNYLPTLDQSLLIFLSFQTFASIFQFSEDVMEIEVCI